MGAMLLQLNLKDFDDSCTSIFCNYSSDFLVIVSRDLFGAE